MRALFSAHPADGHALPAPGSKSKKDTPLIALPGSSDANPAAIYSTGRWAARLQIRC
jgi:hypothetical protein